MTPLPTFLRDMCLAGLGLAVIGFVFGFGPGVAAGAVVGVLNFTLMWLAVAVSNAWTLRPFLSIKLSIAIALLYVLLRILPAGPVLCGFCAPMLAIAVRGFAGLLHPPTATEPG